MRRGKAKKGGAKHTTHSETRVAPLSIQKLCLEAWRFDAQKPFPEGPSGALIGYRAGGPPGNPWSGLWSGIVILSAFS